MSNTKREPLLSDDGKTERVFTESEVRDLVDTLCAIPNFIPHKPLAESLKQTMREVSARYLDPA